MEEEVYLYWHGSFDEMSDNFEEEEDEFTETEIIQLEEIIMTDTKEIGRTYQIALLTMATQENVIICLPTGAGKTYIAVELTRYYLPDAIERTKKIVFVANTVPLVHQQVKYFQDRICLSFGNRSENHIRELTGDMNVDLWRKSRWDREIETAQIFVMTAEILRKALEHAFIPFSKINLLILDECHHAGKDHPMAKIMEKYESISKNNPEYELPRVLGLTATIIRGNSVVNEIPSEVRDMEKRLSCKAVTYHDYEEVLRHSTKANIQLWSYSKDLESDEINEIVAYLDRKICYIDNYKSVFDDSRQQHVDEVDHHTLRHVNQMYNKKKKPLEELTKVLKDVKRIGKELGLYAMRLAACIKIGFLQLADEEDELRKLLTNGASTSLSKVVAKVDILMSGKTKSEQIQTSITDKVKELFQIFFQWKESNKSEELCAIVFCTERLTAQILNWIFEDATLRCGDEYKFIKPAFVVGCSRNHNDIEEQRITIKKQEEVIKKFHRKEVNLVFATNVLEEGLNVPSCSLIIRFDGFRTYPSFIQSMGRARKKNALFYVLTSDEEKTRNTVNKYSKYCTELAEHLKSDARHLDVDDDDSSKMTDDRNDIAPLAIDPTNPDSPKITLTDAVSLVHTYCQTLSCDKIVVFQPYAWCARVNSEEEENKFKAYVQLPSNALVKGITEGTVTDSKNGAKRIAYLEVCRRLYARGAFNEQLLPFRRSIPPHITKFIEDEEDVKFINGKKVGTQKRTQWYSKKIPDIIEKSVVRADVVLNVYEIRIELTKPMTESKDRIRFFQFKNKRHGFALLTEQKLTEIAPVELESHYGFFESTYVKVNLKTVPDFEEEKILKLKEFQHFIFSKILRMTHSTMKIGKSDPFLIAALIKDNNGDWDINWNLMDEIKNFDESHYRQPVLEEERRHMSFSAENYEDAVVVPWHIEQTELSLHCVLGFRGDSPTFNSPIIEDDPNSESFFSYYSRNYDINIVGTNQPYLVCCELGNQLNFLSHKINKTQKAQKRDKSYHPNYVPELCRIYPMSASLLAQSRFLPSILHRTYRLMLSAEIHRSMADHFNWTAALNWKTNQNDQNDHSNTTPCPSPSKKPRLEFESASPSTLLSSQIPGSVSHTSDRTKKREKWIPQDYKNKVHLEYIHPETINQKDIQEHKLWMGKSFRLDNNVHTKTKKNTEDEKQYPLINMDDIHFPSLDTVTDFNNTPGPSPVAIMEALTVANANDRISLENLEVIGDSFLKYAVSTMLYFELPDEDEGVMTRARNKLVSNSYLYTFGSKKKLGEFVSGGIFNPVYSTLPPGTTVPEIASAVAVQCDTNFEVFTQSWTEIEEMTETQLKKWVETNKNDSVNAPTNTTYTHTRLGDKNIADSVEALIGAYYMHGGMDAALRFMEWLGLKFPNSDPEGESVKYRRCTPSITNRKIESRSTKKTPEGFMPFIDELEKLIDYKFSDRWLLVEAFSHPGYLKNDVTNCYQRLEFLGDAVLDFLVTNHIYKNKLAKTPGDMTDLRSALVNNVTFGSLVVRYGFQKYLLSVSKQLQDVIDKFIAYQNENGHPMTGHFKLLNDLESPVAEEIDVPKVLGDIFESLAGAVYLDCNMSLDTTWKIFYRLMKNEIDDFTENTPKSPIRELYEKFPGRIKFTTHTSKNEETTNRQGWTFARVELVGMDGKMYFGSGTNIKQAKQAAAKYAIKSLSISAINN